MGVSRETSFKNRRPGDRALFQKRAPYTIKTYFSGPGESVFYCVKRAFFWRVKTIEFFAFLTDDAGYGGLASVLENTKVAYVCNFRAFLHLQWSIHGRKMSLQCHLVAL